VRFIGDIHADGAAYAAAVAGVDESIQVGDLEIGIAREEDVGRWPCQPGSGHRFIRGNHDSPPVCRNHPQFIESGAEGDMFFVNGAWSIDQDDREENKDWWPDEEHSQRDLDLLFEAWSNRRPRVMVSHDCPWRVSQELFQIIGYSPGSSRTARTLQAMFDCHQPGVWVFGHWHKRRDQKIGATRFICLERGGWIDIDLTAKTAP